MSSLSLEKFLENHIEIKDPVKVFDSITNKVVRIKGKWLPIQNAHEAVRLARKEEQAKVSVVVPKDLVKKSFYAISEKDNKKYIVVCYTDAEFILRKAVTKSREEGINEFQKQFNKSPDVRKQINIIEKQIEIRVRKKERERMALICVIDLEKTKVLVRRKTAVKIFEELERNENVTVNSKGKKPMQPALITLNRKTYFKIKKCFLEGKK